MTNSSFLRLGLSVYFYGGNEVKIGPVVSSFLSPELVTVFQWQKVLASVAPVSIMSILSFLSGFKILPWREAKLNQMLGNGTHWPPRSVRSRGPGQVAN